MAKTVKKTSTSKLSTTKVKNSGKLAWFKRLGRMQQRSLVVLLVALVGVGGFLTYRSFAGGITFPIAGSYTYNVDSLTGNGYSKVLDLIQTGESGSTKRKAYVAKIPAAGEVKLKNLPSQLFSDIKNNPSKELYITYTYTFKAPLAGTKYSYTAADNYTARYTTVSPRNYYMDLSVGTKNPVKTNDVINNLLTLKTPSMSSTNNGVYLYSIKVVWLFQDI